KIGHGSQQRIQFGPAGLQLGLDPFTLGDLGLEVGVGLQQIRRSLLDAPFKLIVLALQGFLSSFDLGNVSNNLYQPGHVALTGPQGNFGGRYPNGPACIVKTRLLSMNERPACTENDLIVGQIARGQLWRVKIRIRFADDFLWVGYMKRSQVCGVVEDVTAG